MFCNNCGKDIGKASVKFCPYCGYRTDLSEVTEGLANKKADVPETNNEESLVNMTAIIVTIIIAVTAVLIVLLIINKDAFSPSVKETFPEAPVSNEIEEPEKHYGNNENNENGTPEDANESEGSVDVTDNSVKNVGDTAPDFSVDLLSGKTFILSDQKGKPVFLNFWASWCPPCVTEMPAIQELSEKYTDSVVFIGVNFAEDASIVEDFIKAKGFTYNIGIDETGSILMNLYPSDGIPYTLIIDADGFISEIFLGGGPDMLDVFDKAIKEAKK